MNEGGAMDELWVKVVKATGSVGVVAFLLYFVLDWLFSEQIVELFGGEKIFLIVLLVLSMLCIALIVSIWVSREKVETPDAEPNNHTNSVTYRGDSTHNGDNNF